MEGQGEQSQFQKDLIESEQQFKEQFDPSSKNYHGGDQTVVPVGGARVPETMKEMYPKDANLQEYLEQPQQTYFGEEYEKIAEQRTKFQAFKKQLAKMTQLQESVLRQKLLFEEKKDETHQQKLKSEQQILHNHIQNELLPLVEVLEQSEFKERYNGIRDMIDQAENDFKNKTELGNWFLNYKKFGQFSFNDASTLMQKMKKAKKDFLDAQQKTQEQKKE
ncbi:hypothetical protein PPERSA_05556 [Pseudocohnilembus persalinus]|uniref:Uncharacterized protein n=1 Tax=Pseudocohnilembus persalinus TaxID=266149 RepID=A0A0V0QTE0_PSEPJ|nr:hypothetical protein PPERSA_05556 [Pseudocohnilembus persalinus]|eukprot:KRX05447.1 hypothetical protein PPERSA_05556 [Pseudocohnilembus persalinus]